MRKRKQGNVMLHEERRIKREIKSLLNEIESLTSVEVVIICPDL